MTPTSTSPRPRFTLADLPPCTVCHGPLATCACSEKRRDEFYRASGDCLCACGREYWRHPHDPVEEWLHILCNGERVKL